MRYIDSEEEEDDSLTSSILTRLFLLLQLYSFLQWPSLSLLLYPSWTFDPELVSEILPTPVVDLIPRVASLDVSSSIEIPLAINVL